MLREAPSLDKQLSEFNRALVVATYFGFQPIAAPKVTRHDIELVKDCALHPYYDATEKMAIMRNYVERNLSSLPHPLALAYKRPDVKKKASGYSLHFIGSPSGIAEATLIRTALSILAEEGYKNLRVDINCIGDKESVGAYEREVSNFIRKFGSDFSEELRLSIKEDLFSLFRMEAPEAIRFRESVPPSITFLSSQSRIYFKEVLEYVEALGIDFRLAPELVGERNHASHTIFAIKDTSTEQPVTLAVGYRYSRLGRYLGLRKEIPMAAVNIFSSPEKAQGRIYKELPKPKFYLVQLGRDAKIKTLTLIELLRRERIPVHHLLGRDKITTQLTNAENLRVSHLIIIGQKEAIDNTATIRNISTRAQDTISMVDLPRYLKKITL